MPRPLTPRQQAVAQLIADGYTDKQIADALHIELGTVAAHVHRIASALHVDRSRNVRVQIARRVWTPPDGAALTQLVA